MSLQVGCPRCAAPVTRTPEGWVCVEHGVTVPLWRPGTATYEDLGEHLRLAAGFPTYLPWPMSPGWRVTDFAVVAEEDGRVCATLTCCSGTSALDGPVDVLVVSEETGTGLGARVAGLQRPDPGPDLGQGPPSVKVRLERQAVGLWPVSTAGEESEWDRSVVAGEAEGRWLWLVLRPASAVLLLRDDWILRDVGAAGPSLVEMPFGGPGPSW